MATAPSCALASGNSSSNVAGTGCAAADLCAAGWHVCASDTEVSTDLGGATCAAQTWGANLFFATQQSGQGGNQCNPTGDNDLFGCGSLGGAPGVSCTPLNETSCNLCSCLDADWNCGADAFNEALNVTKADGTGSGGVLCCHN
jgi:hypothetical protein